MATFDIRCAIPGSSLHGLCAAFAGSGGTLSSGGRSRRVLEPGRVEGTSSHRHVTVAPGKAARWPGIALDTMHNAF